MPTHIEEFVAIDPLALFFRGRVLQILLEMKHPHVPSVGDIAKALENATAEERNAALSRARTLGTYAKNVEEAAQKYGAGGKAVA
ncbi:MAG TPA: hypothetical protein VN708_15265 [Terriglobales bacterium]|jgi:hypothetical protein|nr:hypothetical protein [Terriglobales bacterium]